MTESISKQLAWADSEQIGSKSPGSLVPGSSESIVVHESESSPSRVVEPTFSKAALKSLHFSPKLPTKVHFRNKEEKQREKNTRASITLSIFKADKEGTSGVVVTSVRAHRLFLSHCWRNVDLKDPKNEMFSHLTEKGCVFWADFLDLQDEGAVEWRKEIEDAIRGCNKFVAFIDLQYLLSFNCMEEMAFAIREQKPLVLSILDQGAWDLLTGGAHGGAQKAWNEQPSVGMPLSSFEGTPMGRNRVPFSLEMLEQIFSAVASINFCPCRELDIQLEGKDRVYERLHRFIEKDLEYSKEFADLKQRAEVWEDAGRASGHLLPKKHTRSWVEWIQVADRAESQPAPTWVQREYVMCSKKRALRQAKLRLAALIVALVLILASAVAAAVMAVRAESLRKKADEQRKIAELRQAEAEYQGAVASALLLSADRMPYTTAGIRAQTKAADLAESNHIPEVVLPALHDTVKHLVAKPYQFLDLEGHRAQINSVDFSLSGSLLLSSSKDGKIIVWPITWDPSALVPELVEPTVLSGDWGSDHCIFAQWMDDDTFAAAFEGGGFQVWQKQAGGGWRAELIATPHKKKIMTMALSRDGSKVATGDKGMNVALWGFNKDIPLNELSAQTFSTPDKPLSMVFSPDGQYLIFGFPKGVLAYCDVREESGSMEQDEISDLMELPASENVGALAFSLDGHWLAAGLADGTAHLIGWNKRNVTTSRVIYTITSPTTTASSFQAVVGLTWSSETTLIVAVDVGTVSMWKISKGDEGEADSKPALQGQLVRQTSTTSAPIPATGVAFSGKIGGGTIALSSEESMLRLWFPTPQLGQRAPLGFRMQITPDHPSEITVMAWSRTRMAACSAEGDIGIWELIPATGHWHEAVASPVFDGSMAEDGQCRSLAWAPDESMVAAGTVRSTVEVWQRQQDGGWEHVMHGAAAGDVRRKPSFSPDSRWLAVPGKGSPEIWLFHVPFHAVPGPKDDEVLTQPDHILRHKEGEIKSVAWALFSPSKAADLLLASSGEDSTRLWDLSDVSSEESPGLAVQGTTILPDLGFQYATQMDWSADGRLFAMSHEGIGQVWHWKHDLVDDAGNVGAWAALLPVEGHTGILGSVSWSPDGSQLVVPFDDNSLRIYDVDGKAERAEVLYQIQHKCEWLMWIPVSLDKHTEASRIACANTVRAAAVEGEEFDFAFDMLLVDFEEQQRLLQRMTYGRLTDRDLQILRLERLEEQVLPKLADDPAID